MAAINANIIHHSNNESRQKRRYFIKKLGLALISDHLRIRKDVSQLPREMRKRMSEFVGKSSEEPPAKVPGVRKRCQDCPYKKHRKTTHTCEACRKFICPEHVISYCQDCSNKMNTNN